MRRFLSTLAVALLALPAAAQMAPSTGGAVGGAVAPGIRDQGANTTDTFDGVQFVVQRIIRDPSAEGAFRLIVRVVESDASGRRIAIIPPQAVLVDEMGNIYGLVQSTGVPICSKQGQWEGDAAYCSRYRADVPVRMVATQPLNMVMLFTPGSSNFSADLASLAATASLQARIAIYSPDLQKISAVADVIINGIELPAGGS